MEEMYERAEFAKELGSVIVMIDLTVGYTAIQSMSKWARANGVILHLHRAGHSTYTRQKTPRRQLPRARQVVPADRRRPHPRRHGRRQARGRPGQRRRASTTCCARTTSPRTRRPGIFFDQDWASMPGVMPVASGGIHAGQMHQLLHYLGEDVDPAVRRRHDRPPDGDRRRRDGQPRRGRGDDPGPQRGPRLLPGGAGHPRAGGQAAARSSTPRSQVWKDVTFDFESTDTPDVVVTPTAG